NYLLSVVGLAPWRWTYSSQTALYALALVDVWQWTPLIMLIALAGLASLPREPYEAAHLDGASTLRAFWHITLPLLRPTLVPAVLRAFQRHHGRIPRGVHEESVFPLHVEQPGGGGGLHGARSDGGAPRRLLDSSLAPAAAGRGHPGGAHHSRHRLPDSLVHLL